MTAIECRIALAMTPGLTATRWLQLEEQGMTPEEFDATPLQQMELAEHFLRDEIRDKARKEASYAAQHNIRVLFVTDDEYPWSLRQAEDAPLVLYALGNFDFNAHDMISVVGTRRCSAYGLNFCDSLVSDIAQRYGKQIAVVSGLALGIDGAAHKAALREGMPTVAVLAHGLHMVYPAVHRSLAAQIIKSGGAVITQYSSGEQPFRTRFLERNRIVAALSQATVVVESEIKGGAMSTANLAFNYNREVMALPGRISDTLSSGCNHLIRQNKARLFTCAADLGEILGWSPFNSNFSETQRNLFPELDGDARLIYDYLRLKAESAAVDQLHATLSIPVSKLISALSELEFEGIVTRLPGNRYQLC